MWTSEGAFDPYVPVGYAVGCGCAIMSYDQHLYFGLTADTHAMPDVAVFQNTFIRSHDEEGDWLTSFMGKIDNHSSSNRFFLNNIVLG